MTLLIKRFSTFLFLDLLCQLTEQQFLKSPRYTAKILFLLTVFSLLLARKTNEFFLFPLSFLSLLALFYPFSDSSLQLCCLRVIHPLFFLLSKSLHAFWAASIKEVAAAQQSLGRAEQRHQDERLGPAPLH